VRVFAVNDSIVVLIRLLNVGLAFFFFFSLVFYVHVLLLFW